LTLDTAKAQRSPIAETDLTNPQQWLRFKRDRLQDFMENAPRPTGSIERRYGPLEKLRPEPQINYQNHPLTLEARGEQPSILAEQLGYRSIAPRAMAGPTERIPLPRPRPYQEGGEVEDRFAGLPSSSNIEDRRDEDEL